MRPSALDPLFAPAGALPGIGPKNAKLFDRLLDKPQGARVLDVLFHLPQATVDRAPRSATQFRARSSPSKPR
jgi:ATP-dependent DNA helicase RecG